jgi:hypothetical protein
MSTSYTALLAVIGTVAFYAVITFVSYIEQKAINNEQARYANSWCDVDFGSSKATIECSKVSRLANR